MSRIDEIRERMEGAKAKYIYGGVLSTTDFQRQEIDLQYLLDALEAERGAREEAELTELQRVQLEIGDCIVKAMFVDNPTKLCLGHGGADCETKGTRDYPVTREHDQIGDRLIVLLSQAIALANMAERAALDAAKGVE